MYSARITLAASVFGAAILAIPQTASAVEKGLYLEGRAGYSIPADSDLDSATGGQNIEFDNGFAGSLAFGHAYELGLRAEIELGFRNSDIDSITGGGSGAGDVSALSFMGNLYYDLDMDGPLKPYVGFGLGVARLDADGAAPSTGVAIDDTDTALAVQAMAGVAYELNDRTSLTLGYRYFAVPDADFTSNTGANFESEYTSHDFMVGLRYKLGGPTRKLAEPTPVAMPKPAPIQEPAPVQNPAPVAAAPQLTPPGPSGPLPTPRNYLVFFDFDRANITADARAIIESAVRAVKEVSPVKLRATGHADRAGSRPYNQRLSLSRALAVKGTLIRLGIPADDIAVMAKGETDPLVATADGVREPANRRVQIILE